MNGRGRIFNMATLVVFLLVLGMSVLGARTIASETLTIYAYIPERTVVSFTEAGELQFSSNNPSAALQVAYLQEATLLSVIAR